MRTRKTAVGLGAFLIVLCCGGGSLTLTFVGRSMAEKSRTVGSTTEQLRALGMKPTPEELVVTVPAPEDVRTQFQKISRELALRSKKGNPVGSSTIVVAGYATPKEIDWTRRSFGQYDTILAELVSASKLKRASNGDPSKAGQNRALMPPDVTTYIQLLTVHAVIVARSQGISASEASLLAAIRLMKLAFTQPTFGPFYQRLYQEIIILRAAEQCARTAARTPTTAEFLARIERETQSDFDFRAAFAGQVALDSMLIDSKENKIWRDLPFGTNIKDLYRASIAEYWLKLYPQIPTSLEDIDAAEKVFKSAAEDASHNLVIANGASNLSNIVPMARDVLARRRLLAGAIDVIRGKPLTQIDPYSGKPLKTISRDGRDIIYSFGRDKKDDKGMPRGRGPTYPARFDLIFVLPPM